MIYINSFLADIKEGGEYMFILFIIPMNLKFEVDFLAGTPKAVDGFIFLSVCHINFLVYPSLQKY